MIFRQQVYRDFRLNRNIRDLSNSRTFQVLFNLAEKYPSATRYASDKQFFKNFLIIFEILPKKTLTEQLLHFIKCKSR